MSSSGAFSAMARPTAADAGDRHVLPRRGRVRVLVSAGQVMLVRRLGRRRVRSIGLRKRWSSASMKVAATDITNSTANTPSSAKSFGLAVDDLGRWAVRATCGHGIVGALICRFELFGAEERVSGG